VVAGIPVIGGGGRLVMRLLAVTAGDGAQGRITEADEVVGKITTDGTIGFVIFNGIFGGLAGAFLYLLVRRLLPSGWRGGALFGLGLLVVVGTTIDPLRTDNPDFDLVGPGWLAVLAFTILAIAFGVTVSAVAARLSRWLPLPSGDRRTVVRYLPVILVAGIGFSVTSFLLLGLLAVLLLTRADAVVRAFRSPRVTSVGRLVAAGLLVLALPNALSAMVDIAGRG
jgi:hypothetical protein